MEIENTLRQALEPFEDLRLAVLFGSFATGKQRRDSDVDLGVLMGENPPSNLLWRIDCTLGDAVKRPIHSVELDHAPPLLRNEIARDGIVLLEREEGLWTHFKVRAWRDWWEWRPYLQRILYAKIDRLRRQPSSEGIFAASSPARREKSSSDQLLGSVRK